MCQTAILWVETAQAAEQREAQAAMAARVALVEPLMAASMQPPPWLLKGPALQPIWLLTMAEMRVPQATVGQAARQQLSARWQAAPHQV